MEFFTSGRKNEDSPISSFRKADDALMKNAPELPDILTSSYNNYYHHQGGGACGGGGGGGRPTPTTIMPFSLDRSALTSLLFPETAIISAADHDRREPFSSSSTNDLAAAADCTWEERIEREIMATRQVANALAAQLQAKNAALLMEGQTNLMSDLSVVVFPPAPTSTTTSTAAAASANIPADHHQLEHDDELATLQQRRDEETSSHVSVNSYELLQQNYKSGDDPISEERYLSFDSKEDIDYAENRDQFYSQQMERQIVSDAAASMLAAAPQPPSPPPPQNHHAAASSVTTVVAVVDDSCSPVSNTTAASIAILASAPSSPTTIMEDVDVTTPENNNNNITDLSPCSLKRGGTTESENTAAVSNCDGWKSQSHRIARITIVSTPASYDEKKKHHDTEDIRDCLSATESEVASIDGLPSRLQERWLRRDDSARQQMLQNLDGIPPSPSRRVLAPSPRTTTHSPVYEASHSSNNNNNSSANNNNNNNNIMNSPFPRLAATVITEEEEEAFIGPYFEPCFQFNLCWTVKQEDLVDELRDSHHETKKQRSKSSWKTDVPMAILDCSNLIHQEDRVPPRVPTSLVRVASTDHPRALSFAETLSHARVDPRMQDWIAGQFTFPNRPPKDGSFHLGKSRTVIVHEINRGSWTWCTAWSPDGAYLAVATENHHLAVVDTTGSTVWRVRHDRKARGDMARKNNSTHSIRSIAWGQNYIAIGTYLSILGGAWSTPMNK
jgi:hypothetical protein